MIMDKVNFKIRNEKNIYGFRFKKLNLTILINNGTNSKMY